MFTTKNKIINSFFKILLSLLVICTMDGCSCYTADVESPYNDYSQKFTGKFFIKSINTPHSHEKRQRMAVLLQQTYPELFSLSANAAIPLTFTVRYDSIVYPPLHKVILAFPLIFAGVYSAGLIPVAVTHYHNLTVIAVAEGVVSEEPIKIKTCTGTALGLVGGVLKTQKILLNPHADWKGDGAPPRGSSLFLDLHNRKILAVFANAVRKMDKKKIEKLCWDLEEPVVFLK